MTGLELTAKIYAKEIENGTKIKVTKADGSVVHIYFREDKLNWETGTFGTECLFDKNVKFEIVEEEKPKGWFKPEISENYWTIDSFGEFDWKTWINDEIDNYRYNNHNCFRSEEEAKQYLEYKKTLREAQKPFVYGKDNWCISYDFINRELKTIWNVDNCRQGTVYFGEDLEVAQAFIDKWNDCILKYEFDIWED